MGKRLFFSLFITRAKRPGPAVWLTLFAALYALVFGAVLPRYARPFLERLLSEEAGVACTVQKITVNPFTWKIVARNLSVPYPHPAPGVERPPMPEEDFIRLERLELFIAPSSILKRALIVDEARLVKPRAALTRYKDGAFSPQYFFAETREEEGNENTKAAKDIFPLVVRNLTMRNGSILFRDDLAGTVYDIRNIGMALPFASTLRADRETTLTPAIAATVNGNPVSITGETRPFANARQTSFTLRTRDLSLPELRGYIAPYTRLVPISGTLHTALTLRIDSDPDDVFQFALAGTAEVTNLSLEGPEGIVFSVKRAFADMENILLGPRRIILNEALLEDPRAVVRRGKDGSLDWAGFFTMPEDEAPPRVVIRTGGAEAPAETAGKPPAEGEEHFAGKGDLPLQIVVGKARILRGAVEWIDRSPKKTFRYTAENIEAVFNDIGADTEGGSDFSLSFGTGEESASMRGRLAATPFRAEGTAALRNISLAPFSAYFEEGFGVIFRGGRASADGNIVFLPGAFRITGAALSLADARVHDALRPETPLLTVKSLTTAGAFFDSGAKTLRAESLSGSGVTASLTRGKSGSLLLPQAEKSGPRAEGTPWKISLPSLRLDNFGFTLADTSLAEKVSIPLANGVVTGKNFSTEPGARWSVSVAGKPGAGGSLSLTASGTLSPPRLSFSGEVERADIRPLSPYLRENTRLSLAEGSLGGEFKGSLERAKNGRGLDFSLTGSLGLYGVSLLHEQRELFGWGRVRLENAAFRAPAGGGRSFSASAVTVNAPRLSVDIDETGANSIDKALRAEEAAAKAPPQTPPVAEKPFLSSLSVGEISVRQGEALYTDKRVDPPYPLKMGQITLSLKNLAMAPGKTSPFTAGMFVNGSPVTAAGSLTSLFTAPSGTGTVAIRSLDLARFTQYAAKYLGYPIKKGELTADITLSLTSRRLDAQNRLVISGLELGKKIPSPDAPDLSLPAAVAALRDRDGSITINLPVSGTIGDPQFRISGIVARIIGNVVVKTVTTPFSLLGSLVTGAAGLFSASGPQEAVIVFPPGKASLDAAALAALKTAGKELRKYPGAKITLTGAADLAEKELLIDSWVESRLREMKYAALPAAQKKMTAPEKLAIGPQTDAREYGEMLTAFYKTLPFVKNAADPEIRAPRSTWAMLRNIRASAPMAEKDLLHLAQARAETVYSTLAAGNPAVAVRIRLLPPILTDGVKTGGRIESYVYIGTGK